MAKEVERGMKKASPNMETLSSRNLSKKSAFVQSSVLGRSTSIDIYQSSLRKVLGR